VLNTFFFTDLRESSTVITVTCYQTVQSQWTTHTTLTNCQNILSVQHQIAE